ncbi:hypothetical protein O3V59_21230 [Brevibacillus thermoruber]|uniref:DUF3794 domain-containing protein n=1 Tax=Brevibacillus thermoruber TaxID=33942 RepID=A0A9X3Z5B4_9BACL|nr:hypothetical protein [Brevibacillus thermoruber]MDA5110866.1 hypothetical protein [Brevibacillus thermoruber]
MRKFKPIQGSQVVPTSPVPTPIPNNLQEECIRVQKVYDWVVAANRERNKVPIPDECRAAVDAAIRAGLNITIQCAAPVTPPLFPIIPKPQPTGTLAPDFDCRVISIRRETITINNTPVRVGIVRFLFSATVLITILADSTVICPAFPATIQFDEEFVLCLPEPLDEDNILCRITDIECIPNQSVLLGGMVELEVIICKEIQVEAEVKLEVLAKFCQPRPIIPVPTPSPFRCPPITFPPQCPPLFPLHNCDCQGTANVLLNNVTVFFNGLADIGSEQLVADICPSCNPGASTFSYTFVDTPPASPSPTDDIPGNQSFEFTTTSVESPVCSSLPGGGLQLFVTATGIRRFTETGTEETLFAELTLEELPGMFDRFRLRLLTAGGTQVFDTGFRTVDDRFIRVQDCITFPDVLNPPSIP